MKIEELLFNLFIQKTLIQGNLSQPRKKGGLRKIMVRPIQIQGEMLFQVTEEEEKKAFHRNMSAEDCIKCFQEKWIPAFKQGTFFAAEADYHLLVSKKLDLKIIHKKPSKVLSNFQHNRKKTYLLSEGTSIPFLIQLGVMNPEGKVLSDKYHKFRQINRFLEFIEEIVSHFNPDKVIKIIDFGSGKAYLTFALYHYLHFIKGLELDVTGLDLKEDVIAFCQSVTKKLKWKGIRFIQGDIDTHSEAGDVDLVVSLHACDTATDAALEKAVRWGARVILAVPCCQHELYDQIECSTLRPLLRHGILKERFAALATDAARAHLLTLLGYQTQIVEFIDLEHTPKNLLIRAVKREHPAELKNGMQEYLEFKQLLNIYPSLEKRFHQELISRGPSNGQ